MAEVPDRGLPPGAVRDFGVLVRHAHDDQWDDVVRMAVGHARVEERARLLRQLLKRADRAPRLRHRLVLLAAACLEHAPELDPDVRREVEDRARELVPPRSTEDAEELAKAGELVLELLPGPEGLEEGTAAAVVRTAARFEGDAALAVVSRFRRDSRFLVAFEVSEAWNSFDTESYARDVLAAAPWDTSYLHVNTAEQLHALRHVAHARRVDLVGSHSDLSPLLVLRDPEWLFVYNNAVLTDLTPLASLPPVKDIRLSWCSQVRDISPLARPGLEALGLISVHPDVSVEPLKDMPDLRMFLLNHPLLIESVGELPIGPGLTELVLFQQARYVALDGVERWPGLTALTLSGATQLRQLARTASLARLTKLTLFQVEPLDLELLSGLAHLEELNLQECEVPRALDPLLCLPSLRTLRFVNCPQPGPPVDLGPLAAMEQLTIGPGSTPVTGADESAPSRIQPYYTPAAPSSDPAPYVTAIASAPPPTTRRTAGRAGAAPRRALDQPVKVRAARTDRTVTYRRAEAGGRTIARSGSSAPIVKARKLAAAACQGLVSSSGSMPSSTRAWARRASRSVSCSAASRATSRVRPRASRRSVSSSSSASGCSRSSRFSTASAAFSESRCVETETYSPTAMDMDPASRPARPAVRRVARSSVAPATPTTSPAVETTPSLAPSTAARSQLRRVPSAPRCSSSWAASVTTGGSHPYACRRRTSWGAAHACRAANRPRGRGG